jgi:predicted Fe-Mo cluster-binding NifX family protein
MIKVAFASRDDAHVDMHFGAAERFVVYDVSPGHAGLIQIGQFEYLNFNKDFNKRRPIVTGTKS